MLLTTMLAGFAPLKVLTVVASSGQPSRKVACTLSLLSCFAGGVFLATCFLDVIPHVNANFHMFNTNSSLNTAYPLPELLFCVGFFAVYLLEELCVRLFAHDPHSSNSPKSVLKGEQQRINGVESDSDGDSKLQSKTRRDDIESITYGQLRRMSSIAESLSKTGPGALQSITFAIAMSFHSILEGLALGVQDSKAAMTTLFISLMLHKGIEAFSVGLQISKSNSQRVKVAAITILVYSLMTPIGSLIGICIQNSNMEVVLKEGLITLLEALAVGTFIYVTFFEVLGAERANEFSNVVQLLAIIAGFTIIALFQVGELIITGSQH
ncbi:Zinc transporter ZIP3 [Toxocara canis]|uniref:Zinc transporter ZIP3 n=1 Tax=Toxocara canis TaxID=6265 RepID=A0A0B2VQS3_TOXCA|nr:Zinc transporter ZIP3 [Toxocara canis]